MSFPSPAELAAATPARRLPQYEPEIFPGLVYRMVVPKVVILTFVNGKIVITGAKVRVEPSAALCADSPPRLPPT